MAEVLMRIGELSRAAGVSPDVLRAWERRYGFLTPARTEGGFRLYTEEDLGRVKAVRALVESGVPASEAARRVRAAAPPALPPPRDLDGMRRALREALRSFDDAGVQAAFDHVLAAFDLETVILEVLVPELRAVGDEWASGSASVGQEHFAVNLLRARLLALGRGWDRGLGPRVVLACAPGEQHDVSLIMFGLLVHLRGWRVTFLGADTPIDSVIAAARATRAAAVVVCAANETLLSADATAGLRVLEGECEVYIAGPGASEATAARLGLRFLGGTLGEGAEGLTDAWRSRTRSTED